MTTANKTQSRASTASLIARAALWAAAKRATDELSGERLRMTIDGRTYKKRTEAADAWQQWVGMHALEMVSIVLTR